MCSSPARSRKKKAVARGNWFCWVRDCGSAGGQGGGAQVGRQFKRRYEFWSVELISLRFDCSQISVLRPYETGKKYVLNKQGDCELCYQHNIFFRFSVLVVLFWIRDKMNWYKHYILSCTLVAQMLVRVLLGLQM